MFWETYGSVVRWLFAIEALAGALTLCTIAPWFAPAEPGDELGTATVMVVYGAVAGLVTAIPASLVYRFWLGPWVHKRERSVASRAWTGAGAAGSGALALWAPVWAGGGIFGFWAMTGIGLIPAFVAMLVAGPLTARAARRADLRVESAASSAPSETLA